MNFSLKYNPITFRTKHFVFKGTTILLLTRGGGGGAKNKLDIRPCSFLQEIFVQFEEKVWINMSSKNYQIFVLCLKKMSGPGEMPPPPFLSP